MSTWPVTYRGCVNAWECDLWGHQNVEFYLAKGGDAQAALCCELGLAPSWLREHGARVMQRRDRVLFKRELRAGDPVVVRSGVRSATDATMRYFSVLTNQDTHVVSAVFETEAMLIAIDTGEAIELPANVSARATELARASVEQPEPPPIQGPRAPLVTPVNAVLTHCTSLEAWDADESGHTPPRFQIARFAVAATRLMARMGVTKSFLFSRNLGSAALDYSIEYRLPVRPGEAVDIRSGMLEIGRKVFRVYHHLIADGEIATTMEVAIVFFDLAARKSVPVPEEFAARARELMA